ncbi:MAG: thioredoxin domain-containing protein, partial [Bacteroidia bacterium]|nr:thioredoxin domain-containing protein [Bacteroidia bacterium]
MHKHTNELINETSPYLLQHAHNPVDWHAWNEDNLTEAKQLDKPLLISIGYSSCHWCHVMEHESFVNEKIAKYMNEHFYCIKLDREERPDVDAIYMTAANIITGSGGWPLNCFALPDGKPFHAGTYYPPVGWLNLLQTVDTQYGTSRKKLEEYANKLTQGIRLQETAISDARSEKLLSKTIVEAVDGWKNNWDMKEGGMNRSPKFPMPTNYDFLLSYTKHSNDTYASDFIDITLEKMAYGGIFDQIGGGFSRYSVDDIWKAPHFEKMLYDNAQLLSVYAKAYQRNSNPEYLRTIDKTVKWLERKMLDKSGMFYAALDADSEGEEGKYYVWKDKELRQLLGKDYSLAEVYYQIGGKGLWEHGNNILLREYSDAEIAEKFGITETEVATKISAINKLLLSDRIKRIPPGLDDKCLTSWNAMLVTGLLDAYRATGINKYRILATNCLDALIQKQVQEDMLWHTYKGGKSTIIGMLDSYAFLIQASLDGFYTTGNQSYYTLANKLAGQSIDKCYDADKGIFYFNEENELIVRTAEVYDNVIPATNSVMVQNLTQLGLLNA